MSVIYQQGTYYGKSTDNVVDAYYNPTDGLFYEEQAYTTAITGEANVIYFDISTNDQYKWDGSHFICVNTRSRELTSAEYDALSTAEKKNGAVYYINDGVTDGIHIAKTGFTPVGALIPMSGNKVPAYYLACDGTVYNIADYPELANYYKESQGSANFYGGDGTTTFAVPDLQGEFLRGTGTNSHTGQGDGANVGTHQDATKMPIMWSDTGSAGMGTGSVSNEDSKVSVSGYRSLTSTAQTGTIYTITTRPTNTSVLWCVASKNIYVDAGCDYSTEEKVVGTWIDGKPIYQKTIVISDAFTVAANATTNKILMSGINELVDYKGFYTINSIDFMIPVFGMGTNGGATLSVCLRVENPELILGFIRYGTALTVSKMNVTLRYTKTT